MVKQVSSFVCKHWQWMVGVIGCILTGVVTFSFGAGVKATNLERDIRNNTETITKVDKKVDVNSDCIRALEATDSDKNARLARIEEGVKRTDETVNRIWDAVQKQ